MNYFIIDNGEDYSDHSIYFVRTERSLEEVQEFYKFLGEREYEVVGMWATPPDFWEGEWNELILPITKIASYDRATDRATIDLEKLKQAKPWMVRLACEQSLNDGWHNAWTKAQEQLREWAKKEGIL